MISIKLAKEISIAKWESELESNIGPYYKLLRQYRTDYPELFEHHSCGFCLRHGFSMSQHGTHAICKKCEITKSSAKCCLQDDSLYNLIEEVYDGIEREETIRKLIEIIKNIPEEDE